MENTLNKSQNARPGRAKSKLQDKKYSRKKFYWSYTLIFLIVFLVGFCWFLIFGKTFIWEKDGWTQHYKAMVYYAQYLRRIIKNLLFEHKLYFPQWDFALGDGSDILQSLNYYVIGDPFTLPCVLVPTKYMWVYFDFSILLRMYLAGITFSSLCFYMNKKSGNFAVMAGTLSYVFCYWTVMCFNRHPYFFNPMVFFTLVILGIEKIINKEKPYLFALAVFFSGMSNFYFFYMIVVLTVIYVLVRAIILYGKDVKKIFGLVLKVAVFSVLGVAMAAVIVLPVTYDFLNDARLGAGNAYHLFYPLYHYIMLPRIIFSGKSSYWLCMGYSTSVILGTLILFRRKGHKTLKTLLIISAVIILIPALGQVLNGMSYMSNRWSWALSLLCSYTSVVMWPELMKAKKKDIFTIFVFLGICFVICLLGEKARSVGAFAGIAMAFLFVAALLYSNSYGAKDNKKRYKAKQVTAFVLTIVSILNICFLRYAPSTDFNITKSISVTDVNQNLKNNETKAIKSVAKEENTKDFYRYAGKGITLNAETLAKMSGTNYYWSISNSKSSEFSRDIELDESMPQKHIGYDDRSALTALSSVRYYSALGGNKNSKVPYCFEYVGTYKPDGKRAKKHSKENYAIFRNTNPLSISYSYDKAFGDKTWNKLSAAQKQEAMLQGMYISGYNGAESPLDLTSKSTDYDMSYKKKNIKIKDNKFFVTKKNASVTLNFKGTPNCETYLTVHGLDFYGLSDYDLYFGSKDYKPSGKYSKKNWKKLTSIEKEEIIRKELNRKDPTSVVIKIKNSEGNTNRLEYYNEDYTWYSDRHDYTINLGYNKNALTSVKITFPEKGVYSFDSIGLVCQPMDNFESQVSALKQDTLQNVKIGTDRVTGDINLDNEKYLCFSIPYSDGWTAYVDGKETKLLQANVKNMALKLSPGKHKIELKYQTPMLKYGAALSVAAALLFLALVIISALKTKKKRKNDIETA